MSNYYPQYEKLTSINVQSLYNGHNPDIGVAMFSPDYTSDSTQVNQFNNKHIARDKFSLQIFSNHESQASADEYTNRASALNGVYDVFQRAYNMFDADQYLLKNRQAFYPFRLTTSRYQND